MRTTLSLFAAMALVASLGVGCAGPEAKLGRGISNMSEIVRMNEFQRAAEQHSLFDGPDTGMHTGIIRGFNKTMARTGVGIYEVITFPIPSYDPVWTSYLSPNPKYPDAYHPAKWDLNFLDSDHNVGFSGGDVAPWFPGSHFRVFDN